MANGAERFVTVGDVSTRYESCGTFCGVENTLSLNFAGGTKTCNIFLDLCPEDKNWQMFLNFVGTKTCKVFVHFVW